ncbi:MAG: DUF1501 domain-containing protein [Bacteroidetes bacterium]|nr:DUF1501 domain-containing protein [Bacteroidota bacterium]
MQRRDFIKNVAPVAFLGGFKISALSNMPFLNALAGASDNDHVLVLIQLVGGNDSLNTVIPIDVYGKYAALRPNIAIPESSILPLGNFKSGLHPAMTGMQSLYNDGQLAVIQGVGYPSPDTSHFRSTDIWLTGSNSDQYLNTGWTGRFLGQSYSNYPVGYPNASMPDPLAIQIGSVISPMFMSAGGTTAMAVPTDASFYNLINGITEPAPNTAMGTELTYLRAIARQTNKYASAIEAAAKKVTNQYTGYPANNELADQLKTVAMLVGGGLKTKVYLVEMGGFDTHGGQVNGGDTTTGAHANLLTKISEAISAFMTDLQMQGIDKRVLGMTFSEFSRRVMSNGSMGTDHGAAQSIFIFGDAANAGVLGQSPDFSAITNESNLPMQYDFRSVYSSILRDWFCVAPTDVSSILMKDYQYLPFIKSTACNMNYDNLNNLGNNLISNSPNPFNNSTSISFKTSGGYTLVQIFDASGRLVMIPVQQDYPQGTYTVSVDTGALASGVYYARLQNQSVSQVRTMLKVTEK